jgi:hypothetical protein
MPVLDDESSALDRRAPIADNQAGMFINYRLR